MSSERRIARDMGNMIAKHNMIEEGDRILIGLSGGKDSWTLLDMLLRLKARAPVKFELFAATLDPGFDDDFSHMKKWLEGKVSFEVITTTISASLEKLEKPKTGDYCFLCSRLRRGFLTSYAKKIGCNKLALGHNLDDAIETLLLNLFYGSSMAKMRPKYLSKAGIKIIRPLMMTPESVIAAYAKERGFPILVSKCPFKPENSKRKKMKSVVAEIAKDNPMVYKSLCRSLAE